MGRFEEGKLVMGQILTCNEGKNKIMDVREGSFLDGELVSGT